MKSGKQWIAVILMLILAVSLLSACNPVKDSAESRSLCESFLNKVIANDRDAAYAMVEDICTVGEFDSIWEEMRQIMSGSSSYELTQTGYYFRRSDGVNRTSVSFEAVTDDNKIMQLQIVTQEGIEGIAELNFSDSTGFVEKTSFVPIVNFVFIVISVLLFAFVIWMLVDCCRRKIGQKLLWILLILVGVSFNFSIGGSGIAARFGLSLLLPVWSMMTVRASTMVVTRISLPFGAILYFFLRKRLKPKENPSGTADDSGTPEGAIDGQTSETAEEQTEFSLTDGATSPDNGLSAEQGIDTENAPGETETKEQ